MFGGGRTAPEMTQLAWIEALAAEQRAGRPCVLVTVSQIEGSAPCALGARMLVGRQGQLGGERLWGTIGGGRLELLALEHAGRLLAAEETCSTSLQVPLAERAGQCCGGRVTLLIESFAARRPVIAVFGAGHVGQALGGLAPWLDARLVLIDSRERGELGPEPPADPAFELRSGVDPEEELAALPPGSLVVIMTHDHAQDQELVAAALAHPDLPFIGLIGSERKWARFRARLERRGLGPGKLDRVVCPIGLGPRSKEPRAIALSVAAQLAGILCAKDPSEASRGA